jgi:hypothetical protein
VTAPRATGVVLAALCLAAGACAPHAFHPPQGPGEPASDYEQLFGEASAGCRDIRTLTAEASVSGVVGRGKVRGRVIAGFERPGRMRLEGVAPIGPPAFVLAADGPKATLLMPRSREVLAGEAPERVLEALVGVTLLPDELEAILGGCVVSDPRPTAGRRFAGGWVAVDLAGGNTVYLQQDAGRWRIRAGLRPLVSVEYEFGGASDRVPRTVQLHGLADGGPGANLRLTLSQVEVNVPIDPKAFAVALPPGTVPITLADLRQSGPMGEK